MKSWNPKYGDRVTFKVNTTTGKYEGRFYHLRTCLDENKNKWELYEIEYSSLYQALIKAGTHNVLKHHNTKLIKTIDTFIRKEIPDYNWIEETGVRIVAYIEDLEFVG